MIGADQLDSVIVLALPELASDRNVYEQRRLEDPEFTQSFFSYSFVPTLQVALDQKIEDFCRRAFALIEHLVSEGDEQLRELLRDEFFEYGPVCEKWMKRAEGLMGPKTRAASIP